LIKTDPVQGQVDVNIGMAASVNIVETNVSTTVQVHSLRVECNAKGHVGVGFK